MRSFPVLSIALILGILSVPLAAQLPEIYALGGDLPHQWMGVAVDSAGDVDADGVPDIVSGAWSADVNGDDSGMVRVVSGATGATLYTFLGDNAYDRFGWAVAGAGDVNGDGHDDVVVGAPYDDNGGSNAGTVRVFSGADGSILFTVNGIAVQGNHGYSVAGVGDVNGDGYDDVAGGANEANFNGSLSGTIRVYSGLNGSVLFTRHGPGAGARFGASIRGLGDLDGDGRSDFFVGAPGAAGTGQAFVYSGANASVMYTFSGDSPGDEFGESLSDAGDVDGDGVMDMIVGAYRDDNAGPDSGSARVFSGATGAVLYTFNADSYLDRFGITVSGAGDMNDDGFADLIVGAPQDDDGGANAGMARVFSGADGSVLETWYGNNAGDAFGWSVAALGDVNGDGFADVGIGAPTDDLFANNAGTTFVMTLCGVRSYGASATMGASNSLSLSWLPGPAGSAAQGSFESLGASGGTPGFFGVSSASAAVSAGSGALLIDPTPGQYFLVPSLFDATGRMAFPGTVTIGIPGLKGVLFYMQALSVESTGIGLSNGLEILVGA